LSSYMMPIFLSGVFAIMLAPLYARLLKFTKGGETSAALLTVLSVFFVLLIPLIFFGMLMFQEVVSVYDSLTHGSSLFLSVDHALRLLEGRIQTFLPAFELRANFSSFAQTSLGWAAGHLNDIFANTLAFSFQVIIFLISMFFLSRDGKALRALAVKWSPLPDAHDEKIFTTMELAVNSVIKGALVSSFVQGLMVGIGFTLFGVANPVLWGVLAAIAALIPPLGSAIVTVPAAIFMIISGHLGIGLCLIGWGVLVGVSDNIVKPIVMGRGINMHPFIILLSVIGGIAHLGPAGFIAGPVVVAAFFALISIYPDVVLQGREQSKS